MRKDLKFSRCLAAILTLVLIAGCSKNVREKAASPSEKNTVVISAMGDIALNYAQMGVRYRQYKDKFGKKYADNWPFSGVKSELKGIIFGNLESPISNFPVVPYADKDEIFYFKSPGGSEDVLKAAGFTVISVANNHIKDAGVNGMFDTRDRLEKLGIKAPGVGANLTEALKPAFVETDFKGRKVRTAILAVNTAISRSVFATADTPGTATGSPEMLSAVVRKLREQAEIVVVSCHWGDYYTWDLPVMKADDEMRTLGHALIDAGASLVIGHHSHAVGEIERYKNGIILYSLGEFIFAGRHTHHHATSIIARMTVSRDGVESYTIIPVYMNPLSVWYRPVVLDEESGNLYLSRIILPKDDKYRNYFQYEAPGAGKLP